MKINRVVTMLGATTSTGKLASDMYDLNNKTYYSEAEQKDIPISDMDFQHMVRAFVKLSEQEDMLDRSKHFNRTVEVIQNKDKTIKKLQDDLKDGFKQSVDDLEQLTYQEKIINGLRSQVETLSNKVKDQDRGRVLRIKELNEKVERLEDIIEERDEQYDSSLQGYYYTFTEVPQDEKGKEFVKNCKKYLNKDSYKIRVKGQHLKKELYGQGRAYHGANMEDSTHMRVYIDTKRGDE